ncbi:MAG: hypothetical protein RXR01_01690, partial [Thermoproteus sp.]
MPDDRSEKKATRIVSLVYFELSTVRAGAGSALPPSLRRFADFSAATCAAARRPLTGSAERSNLRANPIGDTPCRDFLQR